MSWWIWLLLGWVLGMASFPIVACGLALQDYIKKGL